MDIEKKIDELVEEYQVFYSGNISEFLTHNNIHPTSKIATLVRYKLNSEPFYSYHAHKIKIYIDRYPNITYAQLCSKDSLWFW